MKVALVHDWLNGMRGGEYVLEAIAELFPGAELFTLLYEPGTVTPTLLCLKRHVSALERLPQGRKRYRYYLPLMPRLIERFDLTGFDLVVSSSHCVAKGIRKPPGAVHISYVHAPMRYMWDRFDDYFGPGRSGLVTRSIARLARPWLQSWDRGASSDARVDRFIANSHYIADQIRLNYGRESVVVHPFANLERFARDRKPGRHYLIVGAMAPYKRFDLAVEAFNRLKLPLLLVGVGQDFRRLKKLAGPTVEVLGALSNSAIEDLLSKCRAFVFPGVEDFGIGLVEALAAGAPVIAYRKGGALDIITEETGTFFDEQSVDSLCDAIEKIELGHENKNPIACRERAKLFTRERFQTEFKAVVEKTLHEAHKN